MISDLNERRLKAYKKHRARWTCSHEGEILTARSIKGGAVQYVYQCQRCGRPASNPVSRIEAYRIAKGEPPPFDAGLKEAWEKGEQAEREALEERVTSGFWAKYAEYLQSAQWRAKRAKVFHRAGGICEGCREKAATQVHHLTYKHVGDELLFELVALCNSCHDRVHEDDNKDGGE